MRARPLGRRLAAALALCGACATAAALGCSNRERANPLDPGNPLTGGSPAGFRAVAGSGLVDLVWLALEVPDLVGYELLRRGPTDTDFVSLTPILLPPTTSSFRDTAAGNDTTYTYRLQFRLTGNALGGSSEASARPGSANVWVSDAALDAVVRYTPDGRHRVLSLFGLNNPVALALETTNGRIWGASGFEGFLALWAPDGALVGVSDLLAAPLALAAIPGSDYTWAADGRLREVLLVSSGGALQTRYAGFTLPSDVAYDSGRLRLWVADRGARRLIAFDASGNRIVDEPLGMAPWRLGLHPPSGDIWVTSSEDGRVERHSLSGALLAAAGGLPRPYALAPDPARDEVWVVLADGDEVLCLDAAAQPVRRLGSLPAPRGVAFDSTRDELWVTTLGRGDGDGALWHLRRDGAVLQTTRGLGRPFAVAIDPARNPAL